MITKRTESSKARRSREMEAAGRFGGGRREILGRYSSRRSSFLVVMSGGDVVGDQMDVMRGADEGRHENGRLVDDHLDRIGRRHFRELRGRGSGGGGDVAGPV